MAIVFSLLAPGLGHLYAAGTTAASFAVAASAASVVLGGWLALSPSGPAFVWIGLLLCVLTLPGVAVHAGYMAQSGKPFAKGRWRRVVVYALYLAAFSTLAMKAAWWVRSEVAEPFRAPSAAMVPTLQVGDHFFADKRAYLDREPQRGDVVVFWIGRDGTQMVPADSQPGLPLERFVKRVVGVPGDRIEIGIDTLRLNGLNVSVSPAGTTDAAGESLELFTELLGRRSYTVARDRSLARSLPTEFVVPPGRYFMLGDNRDHSNDSRFWGTVARASIIGRVTHLYFSRHPGSGAFWWSRVGKSIE